MNVNLNVPFVDLMGKPIVEKGKEAVVADRVASLLFNLSALHKEPMSAEQKYQAYKLCTAIIHSPGNVELSAEQAAFIKEVCSEAFSSGAYGQIVDIIEKNK